MSLSQGFLRIKEKYVPLTYYALEMSAMTQKFSYPVMVCFTQHVCLSNLGYKVTVRLSNSISHLGFCPEIRSVLWGELTSRDEEKAFWENTYCKGFHTIFFYKINLINQFHK